MLLLFRVLELDAGRILIDGADIATLPLRTLRRGIAMLPQGSLSCNGTEIWFG
jgi:ABC-type multidrug transport system fused ATPase/permease subunit